MIEDATINYVKGDTYTRDVTISDYDAEINKVLFTIKNNESDKRALLQKSLEIKEENLFNKDDFLSFSGELKKNSATIQSGYKKIAYLKCRPNTKYSIKMNNTLGNMMVATTSNVPEVNSTINQLVDKSYQINDDASVLKLTNNTYTSGSISAVVSGNKITVNGSTSASTTLTIPLSSSLPSGKYKLCAFNETTANIQFFVGTLNSSRFVTLLNTNNSISYEDTREATSAYITIPANEVIDNFVFYVNEYDIENPDEKYANTEVEFTTNENDKYLLLQYYKYDSLFSEQEAIDSIEIKLTTISNGITLVSDEEGVRTYNILINANDTDNFKVDYDYFFAIKIFTYEDDEDIELTPIKGTFTLSSRGD